MRRVHLALELRIQVPGRGVVLHLESPPDRADRCGKARLLPYGRLDERPEVAAGRPVHAGDPDETAERDHADAVLDSLVLDLRQCGREADVEAPRPHTDRECYGEVAELVQEDEQDQAADDDEPRHAAASAPSASARAARSASTRSSRSRTGSVSATASVSPTTSGMPRNGRRSARNAATAISFAAL